MKGGTIATVVVEGEAAADPPVSISQIQSCKARRWN
jgi:hypothetical protein